MGNFGEWLLLLCSLCRCFGDRFFPSGVFSRRELPLERGRMGSAKGIGGIFAKTCFERLVGVWSARPKKNTRFLIACLALLATELSAHNPEVVGSSPASATRKGKVVPIGTAFFFSFFEGCRTRTHRSGTVRWTVPATSANTGGYHNFRQWRKCKSSPASATNK